MAALTQPHIDLLQLPSVSLSLPLSLSHTLSLWEKSEGHEKDMLNLTEIQLYYKFHGETRHANGGGTYFNCAYVNQCTRLSSKQNYENNLKDPFSRKRPVKHRVQGKHIWWRKNHQHLCRRFYQRLYMTTCLWRTFFLCCVYTSKYLT